MTDRTTVSPPKPESKMPMGRSATVDQSRRSPQQTPHMAIHLTVSALLRASGPELSLEAVLGLVDGALVSAGREVLPPAVGHDEGDVCRFPTLARLGGLTYRAMPDSSRRHAGEADLDLGPRNGRAPRRER